MSESPISLFKYVPPQRVDILTNERIAFSQPFRFNDPFDLHQSIALITRKTQLARVPITPADLASMGINAASRKQRRALTRKATKALWRLARGNEEFAASVQSAVVRESQRAGVLCLSSVKDNLLMWAHYAACNSGLVLEFRMDSDAFRQLGKVYQIRYSKKRVVCDVERPNHEEMFCVKSVEWSYEQEYRILRETRHCVSKNVDGKQVYFCPLPKQAIRSVYIGANASSETRTDVVAALQRSGIQVFNTKLSRTEFALAFERLK